MLLLYLLFIAAAMLLPAHVTTAIAKVVVTGAKVDPQAPLVPPRQNIVELERIGGPQWDLYIQALLAMQAADWKDPVSYFQLSGIHGKPFVEYDGTGPKNNSGLEIWDGYCPHGELLFLPWHRAFIALFEQTLVEHAKKIALTYPEKYRAQYIEAADTLRVPFWDWAADKAVPHATVPQKMTINVPHEKETQWQEVENPLYTFKFPEAAMNGELFEPLENPPQKQTYRCNEEPDDSYPETANWRIRMRGYDKDVYDLFSRSKNFEQFASMRDFGLSIEGIHGGIHFDGGCGGQFVTLEISGFDPLFMLHHTNIDRLWAYWEAIYPDQRIFIGEYLSWEQWATPMNTTITRQSPLLPFRRSESEFHTSDSVLSIYDLGYSYHGLEYKGKDEEEKRQAATRIINHLVPQFQGGLSPMSGTIHALRSRYFAHMTVELSEVERPCSIELSVNGTYAGNMVLLAMPDVGTVYGEVALDVVKDMWKGQESSSILKMLGSWLEIEILKADGSKLDVSSVPSLGVEIEHVKVEPAHSEIELPEYSGSRRIEYEVGKRLR